METLNRFSFLQRFKTLFMHCCQSISPRFEGFEQGLNTFHVGPSKGVLNQRSVLTLISAAKSKIKGKWRASRIYPYLEVLKCALQYITIYSIFLFQQLYILYNFFNLQSSFNHFSKSQDPLRKMFQIPQDRIRYFTEWVSRRFSRYLLI